METPVGILYSNGVGGVMGNRKDPDDLRNGRTRKIGNKDVTRVSRNQFVVVNRATGSVKKQTLAQARRKVGFDEDDD